MSRLSGTFVKQPQAATMNLGVVFSVDDSLAGFYQHEHLLQVMLPQLGYVNGQRAVAILTWFAYEKEIQI